MRILIAGSHGGIGRRLTGLLTGRGDEVVAMIRDPAQADQMRALGAEPLVADLAGDVSDAPAGCDAIVFTAGAGPGSGPGPKEVIDKGGAIKLAAAAQRHGARRYVMVSSIRADDPASGPEQLRPYLEAKQAADAHLAGTDLDWTILRPGRLTDADGDGRVALAERLGRGGSVPRDDVAAVIAAVLAEPRTSRRTLELVDGDTPIAEAIAAL